MKRLSVIIPGYNTPKAWWQRCVASVLEATGPDDEIIVVDDGSRIPVEADWFGVDDRIRILRRDNGGLARARNSALEVAQGEYVTFVDSDDEICLETFDRCLDSLMRSNVDIAVYGLQTVWVTEGLAKVDVDRDKDWGQLSAADVLHLVNRRLFNYACNKVYRRKFLDDHSLRFDVDGMPCEDVIFNLHCVMAGATWATVDYVGYVYYRCGMTLLSSYKPSNQIGLQHASDVWRLYKQSAREGFAVLGKFGECDDAALLRAEWTNMWKPGSPYGWRQKYAWYKANKLGMRCSKSSSRTMIERMVFSFLRRYCYWRCIRRWNIKRQYPQAVPFVVC